MNASQVIEQIHSHGIENKLAENVDIPADLLWAPQGDINIYRLPKLPETAIAMPVKAQLAPGTSRGSRHCVAQADLNHCKFYSLRNPNPLQGSIIEFTEPITIEHPEHKNQTWQPGIIAITYQRRHADEVRRTQD